MQESGRNQESTRWRADLARSWRLWRAFGLEQADPDSFYGALAADSAAQVDHLHPLEGTVMLDVGGGPGYFCDAFAARGATYFAVDADAGEMHLHGRTPGSRTVQASGTALPFAAGSFDLTYSSNVAEHVAQPWRMGEEMIRVIRPGGTIVLSYTAWWGPWGGHETSPWHYLGGKRAAQRYRRSHGHAPKNEFGRSLFNVSVGAGLTWARSVPGAELVAAFPRYAPAWASRMVQIPVVGEVLTWNLMLVLRRRHGQTAGP